MTDEEIDLSELPELDEDWFRRARYVEPNPNLISHFGVIVPDDVREWFDNAPEGRDATIVTALLEYMERHPRAD